MTSYRTRIAALALVAGAFAANAAAEEAAGAAPATADGASSAPAEAPRWGGGDRQRIQGPVQKALDPDGDGTLTAEEIAKSSDALKALDKNADGTVSFDEIMPERQKAPADAPADAAPSADAPRSREGAGEGARGRFGGGGMGFARIFDADKDQVLSAEEIAKAPEALAALDADKDGKVTREELFASFRKADGGKPRGEGAGKPGAPAAAEPKAPDA